MIAAKLVERSMESKTTRTTAAGIPVGDDQNSLTAGPRGPLLVHCINSLFEDCDTMRCC